jgi:hypothetical protein
MRTYQGKLVFEVGTQDAAWALNGQRLILAGPCQGQVVPFPVESEPTQGGAGQAPGQVTCVFQARTDRARSCGCFVPDDGRCITPSSGKRGRRK